MLSVCHENGTPWGVFLKRCVLWPTMVCSLTHQGVFCGTPWCVRTPSKHTICSPQNTPSTRCVTQMQWVILAKMIIKQMHGYTIKYLFVSRKYWSYCKLKTNTIFTWMDASDEYWIVCLSCPVYPANINAAVKNIGKYRTFSVDVSKCTVDVTKITVDIARRSLFRLIRYYFTITIYAWIMYK